MKLLDITYKHKRITEVKEDTIRKPTQAFGNFLLEVARKMELDEGLETYLKTTITKDTTEHIFRVNIDLEPAVRLMEEALEFIKMVFTIVNLKIFLGGAKPSKAKRINPIRIYNQENMYFDLEEWEYKLARDEDIDKSLCYFAEICLEDEGLESVEIECPHIEWEEGRIILTEDMLFILRQRSPLLDYELPEQDYGMGPSPGR